MVRIFLSFSQEFAVTDKNWIFGVVIHYVFTDKLPDERLTVNVIDELNEKQTYVHC